MKTKVSIVFVVLLSLAIKSFASSYVYVEGYKDIPFKLKLDNEEQKEISQNFYIISKVATGIHKLTFTFNNNIYEQQDFNIYIKENGSHGFKLNLDNKNLFYLEDLITQQTIYKYTDINDLVAGTEKNKQPFQNKALNNFQNKETVIASNSNTTIERGGSKSQAIPESRIIKKGTTPVAKNNTTIKNVKQVEDAKKEVDVYDLINEAVVTTPITTEASNKNVGGGDDSNLYETDENVKEEKVKAIKNEDTKITKKSKKDNLEKVKPIGTYTNTISSGSTISNGQKPTTSPAATNSNPRFLGDNVKENTKGQPVTQLNVADMSKLTTKERKQYEKALQLKNKLEAENKARLEAERIARERLLERQRAIEAEKAKIAAEKEAKRLAEEKKRLEEIAKAKEAEEERKRIATAKAEADAERIRLAKIAEQERIEKNRIAEEERQRLAKIKADDAAKQNKYNNNNTSKENYNTNKGTNNYNTKNTVPTGESETAKILREKKAQLEAERLKIEQLEKELELANKQPTAEELELQKLLEQEEKLKEERRLLEEKLKNNSNNKQNTGSKTTTSNVTNKVTPKKVEPEFIDRTLGNNNSNSSSSSYEEHIVTEKISTSTPKTYSTNSNTGVFKKRPKTLDEAVANKYRYTGNCKNLASEDYLVGVFAKLEAKPDDEARMKIANKMIADKNCFSCEDVEQLSQSFNTQNGKFDFMKKMMPFIYDGEDNWQILQNAFGQNSFRQRIRDEFEK